MANDGRVYKDIDGNPFDDTQFPGKHSLIIDPPFLLPDAGWIARAKGFYETVRSSMHYLELKSESTQILDENLGIVWWFNTVTDRPLLPDTYNTNRFNNKSLKKAVVFPLFVAQNGIQIDAQTGDGGAAYLMWVHGIFRGKKVMSEAVHIGAISEHVTLSVHWEIEPINGTVETPPTPPSQPDSGSSDIKGAALNEVATIQQAAYRLRELYK